MINFETGREYLNLNIYQSMILYLPVSRGFVRPKMKGIRNWMTIMLQVVPPMKSMLFRRIQACSIPYRIHYITGSILLETCNTGKGHCRALKNPHSEQAVLID